MEKVKVIKALQGLPDNKIREQALEIGMESLFERYFFSPRYYGYKAGGIEWTGDDAKDLLEYGKALIIPSAIPYTVSHYDAVRIFQGFLYPEMVKEREAAKDEGNGDDDNE